jgi:hypothetical protein
MKFTTIIFLSVLLFLGVVAIFGAVYYETVYKPKQTTKNVSVTPPPQGALVTNDNKNGNPTV